MSDTRERTANAGTRRPEKSRLTVGIMALTDCAPLVIAREKGWFAAEGLDVTLSRHGSWAAVRDRLAVGALDAAQMLAAMPLALTLGLEALEVPMLTACSLGFGGAAITVSPALYRRLAESSEVGLDAGPVGARALLPLIEADRRAGRPRLTFATVYPFSEHHYLLRSWLAAAREDLPGLVTLTVVPPPQMVAALREGLIDGCCVGEPWNTRAVRSGLGHILTTGQELCPGHPGKVLGVTRAWAVAHPNSHRAMIRAVVRAARWLDRAENRLEAARILGAPEYLDAPFETVAMSLTGCCQSHPDQAPRSVPDFHRFHRHGANIPYRSHALWLLTHMAQSGQVQNPDSLRKLAKSVYRPDLYRAARA